MWIFHVLSTKPFLPYLMRQLREREQAPGWMMSSADAAWKPACWVSAGKLLRSPTHQVLKHIETINKSYQSPENRFSSVLTSANSKSHTESPGVDRPRVAERATWDLVHSALAEGLMVQFDGINGKGIMLGPWQRWSFPGIPRMAMMGMWW